MVRAALAAAESLGGVKTDIILMAGRKVSPARDVIIVGFTWRLRHQR